VLSAFIGGADVTSIVQEADSTHDLNKTWKATVKIPVSQMSSFPTGQRLALVDPELPGNSLDHHGTIKLVSAASGEDMDGMVELTSFSSREIWEDRLCRDGPTDPDDPGNYVTPDFLKRLKKAPLCLQDVLLQSADGSDPASGEGTMWQAMGTFPSDGISLAGVPASFPLSIEALANLFAATGELDVVETMTTAGGNLAQIDCYNGNYAGIGGGSYSFSPDGNIRAAVYISDMTKMKTKLRYLLGPRKTDERWGRSIEASNMDIPDNPHYSQGALVSAIMSARSTYGVRFEVRTYDTFGNEQNAVPLYWRLWQDESMWRLQPKVIFKWQATEGIYPTFDIGAQLGVSWDASFMGGGSGTQRAYGRTVRWDVEGVAYLEQIKTSTNGDAL
jgi:hypothetical protein